MTIRLVDVLPALAAELERLLVAEGELALSAGVRGLNIVERCPCTDDFCATFYTQPRPKGAYGPTHRNIMLSPAEGMIILDVVGPKIACVEVLYRDEIRKVLHTILP